MRYVSADAMKDRFRTDLANEGCALRKLLSQKGVINNIEAVRSILDDSSKRIENLCREYATEAGISDLQIPVPAFSLHLDLFVKDWPYPNGVLSEVVESTLLFALSDLAVSYTTIDSAAVLISLSLALTGIGMFALSKVKKHFKRRKILSALMRSYENKVVPQLLKWFDDGICASNGEGQTCGEKNNENFVKIFGKTGKSTL